MTTETTITPTTTETAGTPTDTPVVPGLHVSGGAPIQSEDFPWDLVIVAVLSVLTLAFGIQAIRGSDRPKP